MTGRKAIGSPPCPAARYHAAMAGGILLFGGTFDPIHHGHLIVARAVAERLGAARVVLIPASRPPHKPDALASPENRLAMVRLAISGEDLFEASDVEIRRQGPSYTRDTVGQFRAEHGGDAGLLWLIGADMLPDLPSWHCVEEVLDLAQVVIALRPPWDERIERVFAGLTGRLGDGRVARLRQKVVRTPLIDISSTDIRRRAAAGRSVRFLVPGPVADYIARHRLYENPLDA